MFGCGENAILRTAKFGPLKIVFTFFSCPSSGPVRAGHFGPPNFNRELKMKSMGVTVGKIQSLAN